MAALRFSRVIPVLACAGLVLVSGCAYYPVAYPVTAYGVTPYYASGYYYGPSSYYYNYAYPYYSCPYYSYPYSWGTPLYLGYYGGWSGYRGWRGRSPARPGGWSDGGARPGFGGKPGGNPSMRPSGSGSRWGRR
jgi:hypothetical protein